MDITMSVLQASSPESTAATTGATDQVSVPTSASRSPRAWLPEESCPSFSSGNETGVCDQEGDVTPGFLQFPHLHLAILGHWRVSDWRRRQKGFSEAAPVMGRVQLAGPGGPEPLAAPAAGQPCPRGRAAELPTPTAADTRGSELGLLGLSRWLVCLFAAPWQEGAGEAGESSGQKEGGKWPVWLPVPGGTPSMRTARRGRQALENGGRAQHEEGGAGRKRRRGWRGQRSWVQPTPQTQGGGPGSPGRPQAHTHTNCSRPGGHGPQGGATSAHAHLGDPHGPQAPTQGPSR